MYYSVLIVSLLSAAANAHISIIKPIPLLSTLNTNNVGAPDYNIASPLAADGSDFPCKGYHLRGLPTTTPVETWEAGSSQFFTIADKGAAHNGGSCQASISEDGGATFRVIKSYIGNCPVISASYNFTVPKETKSGNVFFAWTWFNHSGNREMYMNCAAITINGTGGAGLSGFPEIFKANIGPKSPGCVTKEGFDIAFPNPGLDVEIAPGAVTKDAEAGCMSAPTISPSSGSPQATSSSTTYIPATTATSTTACSIISASSSILVSASATAVPFEGCMCSCGGPSGYIVNILPAGGLLDMVLNSTDTATATNPTGARRRHRAA